MKKTQRWEDLENSENSLEILGPECAWLIEYEKRCMSGVQKFFFPCLLPLSHLYILILEQEAKGGKVLDGNPCSRVSGGG